MSGSLAWEWAPAVGALLLAFLLGSLPFGLWVARLYHVENLRSQGSGNIGATNVARVAGVMPGALTLVLDAGKGALAVAIVTPAWSSRWLEWIGTVSDAPGFGPALPWAAGFASVVGHCYSPWLRLRGGKGVATGFGAIAVLNPFAALVGLIAYALAFVRTRTSSMGSIAGLISASVAQLVMSPLGAHLLPGLLMVAVILFRHSDNLDALLENRERTF